MKARRDGATMGRPQGSGVWMGSVVTGRLGSVARRPQDQTPKELEHQERGLILSSSGQETEG